MEEEQDAHDSANGRRGDRVRVRDDSAPAAVEVERSERDPGAESGVLGLSASGDDASSASESSVLKWPSLDERRKPTFGFGSEPFSVISAYVGPNGGGKTLAMVHDLALPALRAGIPVVSTVEIHHPLWEPLESWRQIPTLKSCVLLLDEITSALPSRQHQSMPPELQRVLNQLRKVDVQVGWTAPHWSRADTILREVTQHVTFCVGYFPDPYERDPDGGLVRNGRKRVRSQRRWPANRVFLWRTYDAIAFEEFSMGRMQNMKAAHTRWYLRNRGAAHRLYRTLDPVNLLDHLDHTGVCVVCDGTKRRHSCKCSPDVLTNGHDELAPARGPLAPARGRAGA